MKPMALRFLLPVALFAGCLFTNLARAESSGVKDEAGFFSQAVVEQANKTLAVFKQRFRRDLLIETFAAAPKNKADDLRDMNAAARERYFEAWAADRLTKDGISGVYILICRKPAHVQIAVDETTARKSFRAADRKKLRDLLVDRFKEKEFDTGLVDAIRLVTERMTQNAPAEPPEPREAGRRYQG